MGGGPPRFARSSTSSVLLWRAHVNGALSPVAYGTITRCGRTFQTVRLGVGFVTPQCFRNPGPKTGLGYRPRSLAATDGIDVSFFSSR